MYIYIFSIYNGKESEKDVWCLLGVLVRTLIASSPCRGDAALLSAKYKYFAGKGLTPIIEMHAFVHVCDEVTSTAVFCEWVL